MAFGAVSGWEIALISAGGAIFGALVGGAISFTGIVYSARRERAAERHRELVDALRAYVYATDLWAEHLETLPPQDPPARWTGWVDRWLFGGDRGAYLIAQLIAEHWFPVMSDRLRAMRESYYEASGRLGLIGPPVVLDVAHRMTECLLRWQEHPGPDGLAMYGRLRVELTDVSRALLGAETLSRPAPEESVGTDS